MCIIHLEHAPPQKKDTRYVHQIAELKLSSKKMILYCLKKKKEEEEEEERAALTNSLTFDCNEHFYFQSGFQIQVDLY